MTITDESTSRVADSTAPPTTSSPSFFQKICCCCPSDLKEPPVQLIRSGSLTYQQGATVTAAPESSSSQPANTVISAAKRSVDDDIASPQSSQKPPEADAESVNMNDILMEKILTTPEEDRTEAVEEDVVSISTNVVQEIDENELKKALKNGMPGNDANPKLKGRSGISKEMPSGSEDEDGEVEGENRKMSVIEFIRSEAQAETSTTLVPHTVPQTIPITDEIEIVYKNEKMSEATQSEMSDSDDDDDSETAKKRINMIGMSSKTTARAEKNSDAEEKTVQEFKELSSDESLRGSTEDEDEEEIVTKHQELEEEEEEDIPPPLPLSPPPNHFGQLEGSPIPPPRSPKKSLMYANADDSDSDDEESEEHHPVSPPSNGLIRMHPVNFASHKEEDAQSVSSDSTLSTATDLSEKENDEETTLGVTRISVKSDGRAEIHSPRSPVRVTMDTDRNEVTDDDFSEKLI